MATKIAKWGNSLALRLPAAVADAVSMKQGDLVSITRTPEGGLLITPDDRKAKAIENLRNLRWKLPPDYKFDREELHERGGSD